MTQIEALFHGIEHFKPSEFDHPDKLDRDALTLLDRMRHDEGSRHGIIITVNADYATTGHSNNSRHYWGDAFDIVIRDEISRRPVPLLAQMVMAARYTWGGIGIYPYWNEQGIHVDRRPWTVFSRRAFWYRNRDGHYDKMENFFILGLEAIHE